LTDAHSPFTATHIASVIFPTFSSRRHSFHNILSQWSTNFIKHDIAVGSKLPTQSKF